RRGVETVSPQDSQSRAPEGEAMNATSYEPLCPDRDRDSDRVVDVATELADGGASHDSSSVAPSALGRDGRRRFQKGHHLTTGHALHMVELPTGLKHLHDEIALFEAACLVDEGDVEDIPVRRRALLNYRARIHRRVLQLDDAIELRGLHDRRGKLR